MDTDGYTVVVGSVESHSVESSGTVTFDQVPAGDHVVELEGLQVIVTPAVSLGK